MKTACVVFLVVGLLSGTPARAQGISAGAKAGANFTTVQFKDEPAVTSGRWSGVAGGFVILPFHWGIALQAEGLYAMKGARLRGDGQPDLLLDYLELPILARVSRTLSRTTIYFVGGPAPALRLRARTRTDFGGSTEEIDVSDQLKRFDLGVAGGAGVQLGSLLVEGRYTFGLTNIDKDTTNTARAANRALSITAGWRF